MLELSPFGVVLLFLLGGSIFIMVTLFVGKLLRPHRPNAEKLTTYESGEDTIGSAWGQFNPRYYIIALIFILFEVEIIFLFPWAIVFGDATLVEASGGTWGWLAMSEMFFFIIILTLGLAWAWKEGLLDWVKPQVKPSEFKGKVPMEMYINFNNQQP